jgi:hypothetical protein
MTLSIFTKTLILDNIGRNSIACIQIILCLYEDLCPNDAGVLGVSGTEGNHAI